jgi:hypothetical protein
VKVLPKNLRRDAFLKIGKRAVWKAEKQIGLERAVRLEALHVDVVSSNQLPERSAVFLCGLCCASDVAVMSGE